jgi:hypothetical protein
MRRAFYIVVIILLLALGVGFLSLGAFPPAPPHAIPMQKAIPINTVGHG